MSNRSLIRFVSGIATLWLASVYGCQTLHEAGVPGLEKYVKRDQVAVETEKRHRQEFVLNHSHESLYWLLSHKVSNGMNLQDVEAVLGGPGEQTNDFDSVNPEGLHQRTDVAYKWGPDKKGCSVVIWFRDGHVANYNPKDYRAL